MSVTEVALLPNSRSKTESLDGKRSYSNTWKVKTDDRYDDENIVTGATAEALGLPPLGSIFQTTKTSDVGALVINRSAKCVSSGPGGSLWHVTVNHSNETPDPRHNNTNPTLRPWEIRWSFEKVMVATRVDSEGKPYVTSAGQPYPAVERPRALGSLLITRYESSFSRAFVEGFLYKVNSDTFLGSAARSVMVENITAARQYLEGAYFWQVTYELLFDPNKFNDQLLDAGTVYLEHQDPDNDESPLVRRRVEDAVGNPLDQPELLDGMGGLLEAEDDGSFLPENLKYRDFKGAEEIAFSGLQLNYETNPNA